MRGGGVRAAHLRGQSRAEGCGRARCGAREGSPARGRERERERERRGAAVALRAGDAPPVRPIPPLPPPSGD